MLEILIKLTGRLVNNNTRKFEDIQHLPNAPTFTMSEVVIPVYAVFDFHINCAK